jgi:hypothetical protein
MIPIFQSFSRLFSKRTFEHAKLLIAGAILTPGKRTVTSALRAMGKSGEIHFQNYHRVLNRDRWSPLEAASILLAWLVIVFAPDGTLVFGIDDTIERRRGAKIKKKGIYRDPVRSSDSHFVKASGLRWVSMDLLVEIPWAKRVWALPFLSVLAPSKRYHEERKIRHKTTVDWARQMIGLVRRWLPDREIVVTSDQGYASLKLLDRCRSLRVTAVTRLRPDAGLYDPTPVLAPGAKRDKPGRHSLKGARQPTLESRLTDPATEWRRAKVSDWYGEGERTVEVATGTAVWYHSPDPVVPIRWVLIRPVEGDGRKPFKPQALLCTDLEKTPEMILGWFVRRWSMEVTFEETRAHLGVETQRQWSDLAIERETPVLFGLFSLVTLWADALDRRGELRLRRDAWYRKEMPTFSDAMACVRRQLWNAQSEASHRDEFDLFTSGEFADIKNCSQLFSSGFVSRLIDTLCYAA